MNAERPTDEEATTGGRRARKTRWAVLWADRAARFFITLGGVGTIAAVMLVCIFLVWVVIPLFLPATATLRHDADLATGNSSARPLHLAVDEYLNIGWVAASDGKLSAYRLDNGERLSENRLFDGQLPTCWSFAAREGNVAFGFADGTIQLGQIVFRTSFPSDQDVPAKERRLPVGGITTFRNGILERTPVKQLRLQELHVELRDPIKMGTDSAISLIDVSVSTRGRIIGLLTRNGELHVARITERKNLLTGKVTSRLKQGIAHVDLPGGRLPTRLLLTGLGDNVLLAWHDGHVIRYNTRNVASPVMAETLDVVSDPSRSLTAVTFLAGKTSLVCGDSAGHLGVWFGTKPADAQTADGVVMREAHELPSGSGEVVSLAASPRSRTVAAAFVDGAIRLFHITTELLLLELPPRGEAGQIREMTFSPKDDALLALSDNHVRLWSLHAPHPEASVHSILRPVWYEGYNRPEHVWQSSSASDDSEEKYGLIPLVFGTLKATFYSMFFGVPLALLAAIYTSEFLRAKTKARIKPTIEVMASLPSVVLGFLAALVFAPMVEEMVPACLAVCVTVPFAYLLGAYLWQLIPSTLVIRAARWRMWAMVATLGVGLLLANWLGRPLEKALFAGDVKAWLDGQVGTGAGAWMFVLFPCSALLVTWGMGLFVTPALRRIAGGWTRTRFALLDLAKFLAGCLITVVMAYSASVLLTRLGWDPRGSYVGTYVQRNALVVGFIMGFAIIPIIYTISDDALSAVPESLRAASLGAGATRWQTAIRIVIPTAMSGLFSALMIGLGRAVGETMIVLMAVGNTPIMDWNIFNGFRTLSANIAVELPEAVPNSTHYRMLFLAALALFAMTFVVNTIAEIVRLRFRKRAFQL